MNLKFIAFFAFFAALAISVSAVKEIEFEKNEMLCTKDGVCTFNFFYASGEKPLEIETAKVYADGNEINGVWTNSKGDEIDTLRQAKRTIFTSEVASFMENKIYNMQIKYTDDNGQKSSYDFRISAPGFEFACNVFNMSLDKCINDDGVVTLEISGAGFGQYGNTDLIRDFNYFLPGGNKRHDGTLVDMDAHVERDGEKFIVEIPIGYAVSTAYIRGLPYGCDKTIDDFQTITYKRCETAKPDPVKVTGAVTVEVGENKEEKKTTPAEDKPAESEDKKSPGLLSRIAGFFFSLFGI